MSDWSLSGKVILVTGGARGIGVTTSRELARRGAVPVLADIDTEALAAAAPTVGPDALTLELDVTDPDACERAVADVVARYGRLDGVWANAGIASFGPLRLTDPEAWVRTIEINVLGAYHTIRAALPEIIRSRGYVAVTASLATFAHPPGMSAYATSKAGVEAMCNALRMEVAHLGVDVATIHPTWIDTDMVREGDDELGAFAILRGAMRPPFKKTYPVDRAARDIAEGFAGRSRRICTPWFTRLAQVLRPALTSPLFERDLIAAAPEIERAFTDEVEQRGQAGASRSVRVLGQAGKRPGAPVG